MKPDIRHPPRLTCFSPFFFIARRLTPPTRPPLLIRSLSLSLWLAGLFQGDRPPLSVRSTITGRVVLQGLPSAPAESYAARIWPLLCASSPSEERTLLVPRERHAGNLLFLASSPFTLLSDYVCFIRTRNEGASRKRLKENLIEFEVPFLQFVLYCRSSFNFPNF